MRFSKRQQILRHEKAIADFNAAVPVGSEVVVRPDRGDELRTRTRSAAQLLGGHTPVVWLEGITGAYALERVRLA